MTYCYKIGNFKGKKGKDGKDGKDATEETSESILEKIKSVDGAGSGLDADLFDGKDSSYFAQSSVLNSLKELVNENIGLKVRLARSNIEDSEETLEGGQLVIPAGARVYPRLFCEDSTQNLAGYVIHLIHIELGGVMSHMMCTTRNDGKGYNSSGLLGKAMNNGNDAVEIAIMKGANGYNKSFDIKYISYE